ncbi:MAG: hypothetical protein O2964_08815 [Verrucomicrobia bacterium]|jgi:hypothetical protein|nr:hypothetical protein [Verrucomicrobiota bacterium]
MRKHYSNCILASLVLCLLAVGVGCANYANVDAVESNSRLESVYACNFPQNAEIAIAQMRFGDTTSFIGRFQCDSEELKSFLGSFNPTIVLHTNSNPWGTVKEAPTRGIKWWDAHEILESASGVLESPTMEFLVSVSMLETNLNLIYFKASFESGMEVK